MRIHLKPIFGQLMMLLLIIHFALFIFSCRANREEAEIIPPITAPLSRDYIGYGVITDSFTHITVDPQEDSISLGYLRRGSLVRIIRRTTIKTDSGYKTWVLTDEPQYGWLKEEVMSIYNTESQAQTASQGLGN